MRKRKGRQKYRKAVALLMSAAMAVSCAAVPAFAESAEDMNTDSRSLEDQVLNHQSEMSNELDAVGKRNLLFTQLTENHISNTMDEIKSEQNSESILKLQDSDLSLEKDEDGYYLISNAEELKSVEGIKLAAYFNESGESLSTDTSLKLRLTADIDLDGCEWTPIAAFAGEFDGNGKSLTNVSITNSTGDVRSGLFSILDGTVKNLTISNAKVGALDNNNSFIEMSSNDNTAGHVAVGILAAIINSSGSVNGVEIKNSTVAGNMGVGALAGICKGNAKGCTVTDCNVFGYYAGEKADTYANTTFSPMMIGGFVGEFISHSSISDCNTVNTNVIVANSFGMEVGGFAGLVNKTIYGNSWKSPTITNCHVSGTSMVTGREAVGGFAGLITDGTISESSALADVSAVKNAGGFIGQTGSSSNSLQPNVNISKCSAEGDVVSVCAAGGFTGSAYDAFFVSSYATGNTDISGFVPGWGIGCAGGFVGIADNVAGFSKCFATGDVKARKGVGGFVGISMILRDSRENPYDVENNGGFSECYASGNVEATDPFDNSKAGGFAGQLQGNSVPVNCYAAGTVKGFKYVGGFAGTIVDCGALNCYANMKVQCGNTDTAGEFAGLLSRESSTVVLTNCVYNASNGDFNAIGEEHASVKREFNNLSKPWPVKNPDISATGLTSEEFGTQKYYDKLNEKYTFVSSSNEYKEIPASWDFSKVWAVEDGVSPYLRNLDCAQIVFLTKTKEHLSIGETSKVTLVDFLPEKTDSVTVTWNVSGAGECESVSADGRSVTIKAVKDGLIKTSVLINRIKKKSITFVAGNGGEDGLTADFIVPAPLLDSEDGNVSYCVDTDATLKVKFSEKVDQATLNSKSVTLTRKAGTAEPDVRYDMWLEENGTVMCIKPKNNEGISGMSYGTEYLLNLTTEIESQSGKSLMKTYAVKFSTVGFSAPEVTAEREGNSISISASYLNNIIHYNEEGDEINTTDSAKVYIVVRQGKGATQSYGGKIIASHTFDLKIESGETVTVNDMVNSSEQGSRTFVDVYTWDSQTNNMMAKTVNLEV